VQLANRLAALVSQLGVHQDYPCATVQTNWPISFNRRQMHFRSYLVSISCDFVVGGKHDEVRMGAAYLIFLPKTFTLVP
jgi:hypothetical protein